MSRWGVALAPRCELFWCFIWRARSGSDRRWPQWVLSLGRSRSWLIAPEIARHVYILPSLVASVKERMTGARLIESRSLDD